jgi:lantibiotic modifying enzyme
VDAYSPLYPYWRFGSAGVGTAVVRFQRLLQLPRYEAALEKIFIDTDRKYAVFPGRFTGLAGLGEFLLDMYDLTGERRFKESAQKAAAGIMHFRLQRNGAAFPGELLSRLCCDFGTGSAGIALFLNRLLGKQKNDFMLDQLFDHLPVRRNVVQSSVPALL